MIQKRSKKKTTKLSLRRIQCLEGHTDEVRDIDISTFAKVVVSAGMDSCFKVWNAESGECIGSYDTPGYAMSVSISDDGYFFAVGCVNGTIMIGRPQKLKKLRAIPAHEGAISGLRIASESKTVAAVSTDHVLAVWDILNYERKRVIRGPFECVAVSTKGEFAVTGDRDGAVSLWNLENGKCQNVLRGHSDIVMGVALSKDYNIAVSGSFDHTVRVWDLKEQVCIQTIQGHGGSVHSVGLTTDGKMALSGSKDGTARFWSIPDGAEIKVLEGEETTSSFTCLSGDGSVAVTSSQDGRLHLWEIHTGIR